MKRFIYFDLGNVLVHFCHDRMARQVAEASGARLDQVRQLLFDDGLQRDYELGRLTTAEFHGQFCERTGLTVEPAQLEQAVSDIFWLNDSIDPLIRQLRALDVPLGILSNTCRAHWRWVVRRFRLPEYGFSQTMLSFEEKRLKPDPEIYRRAIERAGVAAEQIVFTDDRLENVLSAREQGIDAIQFESTEMLAKALRQRGFKINSR